MPSRKQVVDKAREYLGTPFQHQGRVKGISCDCVGLPLMIGQELGMIDKTGALINGQDSADYGPQPFDNGVHEEVKRRCMEKSITDLKEGDLVTIKMPTVACHVGIISRLYVGTRDECLGLIHAYTPAGKVVETVLSPIMRQKIKGVFEFGED